MRFIPTRIHGMLDYLMGALLIAAPWILDFNRGGAETWVPVILGAGVIMYSLLTDYELGISKTLSMRTHLMLDLIGGIILAASPWIFGFSDFVYLPHLVLGLAEIGAAVFTEREPARQHTDSKTAHTDRNTSDSTTATDRTKATINTDHNATIVTPPSRPPMGSNTESRNRSEGEQARREREDRE